MLAMWIFNLMTFDYVPLRDESWVSFWDNLISSLWGHLDDVQLEIVRISTLHHKQHSFPRNIVSLNHKNSSETARANGHSDDAIIIYATHCTLPSQFVWLIRILLWPFRLHHSVMHGANLSFSIKSIHQTSGAHTSCLQWNSLIFHL